MATPSPVSSFVLVILDGLGDRPTPATGGKTPSESASTPNLDRLISEGSSGMVQVVGPGVAPESDAGVFALLGYDPVHESPGRGVLEALGAPMELVPGDVALRLNFATSDGAGRILDSRVGRSLGTREAQELAEALTRADLLSDRAIAAEVRATVGHRGVLRLHPTDGNPLSPEVSNVDPFYDRVGGLGQAAPPSEPRIRRVVPLSETPEAQRTSEAINALVDRVNAVLAGHRVNARRAMAGKPLANAILLRNAGRLPARRPTAFQERYSMAGAAITEMPVERGIARYLGLADRFVGPMGADRDVGFRQRAEATARALDEYPFVYVHLKGPDEPGHDGNAAAKREVIEAIDRSFFGPFLEFVKGRPIRMAITADHATPVVLKAHSDDLVPLVVDEPGHRSPPSALRKFGESSAAQGGLGQLAGREVLKLLLTTS